MQGVIRKREKNVKKQKGLKYFCGGYPKIT